MATLILSAVGSYVAGPLGQAIGSLAGSYIDHAILGGSSNDGPRLKDLSVQASTYGEVVPRIYGRVRVAGNVIWSTGLIERRSDQSQGGKQNAGSTTSYTYSASFAVGLSGRPIVGVSRIWADGKLIRGYGAPLTPGGILRLYLGSDTQTPDPLMQAALGMSLAPAHRGMAYAVLEELPLADFANRIPNLTFEVVADSGPQVALSTIVDDVLASSNVRKRLVSGPTGGLTGFVVAQDTPARSVLEAIAGIKPMVSDGHDGTLNVRPVAQTAARFLPATTNLGAFPPDGNRSKPAVRKDRLAAEALPRELQLRFLDPSRDYQTGIQRARRRDGGYLAKKTFDVPAVLAAVDAKNLAETSLARTWRERDHLEVRLGPSWSDVRPGDTLGWLDQPGALWSVGSVALEEGGVTLGMKPVQTTDGISNAVADGGVNVTQSGAANGPTTLAVLDIPPVDAAVPTAARLYLAATGPLPGWRRASLWWSQDGGTSYGQAAVVSRPTVLGAALSALPGGANGFWDEKSSVDIAMVAGTDTLLNSSAVAVLAGANLAVLGSELFAYRNVAVLAASQYRLTGLLRGLRGTENAMSNHAVGDQFVLLSPLPGNAITVPLSAIGMTQNWKALSPGNALGDVAAQNVLVQAKALRPLSPVRLVASVGASGDISVSWIRRSRDGFAWLDGTDVPLAEESERYRVTVMLGGMVKRTTDVTVPGWVYARADQITDMGLSVTGAVISVQQLSAAVGPGGVVSVVLA